LHSFIKHHKTSISLSVGYRMLLWWRYESKKCKGYKGRQINW